MISQKTRKALKERSGGRCEVANNGMRCNQEATETHHMKFRSRGGSDELINLLHCCWAHHRDIQLGLKPYTKKYRTHSWQKEGESEAEG